MKGIIFLLILIAYLNKLDHKYPVNNTSCNNYTYKLKSVKNYND